MTNETTPRPVQNALIVAQKGNETITAITGVDGRYVIQVPLAASVWTVRTERSPETLPAGALAPNTGLPAIFTSNRTPKVVPVFVATGAPRYAAWCESDEWRSAVGRLSSVVCRPPSAVCPVACTSPANWYTDTRFCSDRRQTTRPRSHPESIVL